MDRRPSIFVTLSLATALAAFGAFFVFREARLEKSSASVFEPPSAAPPAAPKHSVSVASPPVPSATGSGRHEGKLLDEAQLMATLRDLGGSDPELTLRLAREGNARFRDDADRAERSWFIVKSLSDLGRHDEARVEGRALVEKYRDTRWGEDVYRHLFVNPPTHPLERGYGKVLESDP